MKRLNVGVIGLGIQSIENHLPGVEGSQFANLAAVCDTDAARLAGWENKLPSFTDHHKMLENVDLDFIIAATPHDAYPAIVAAAAERGVHVLKEKPFARSLDEAFQFKEIAEKSGIHIMTTLQRRFNPIYSTFFQLQNQIGNPFLIDMKYTLFVEGPHEGWRGKKATAGGGCIIDMGYHMIDMLVWYFGLPEKVFAEHSSLAMPDTEYDAEDTANVLFSYTTGLHGSMQLSRSYAPKTEYIHVVGDRGIIDVERGRIRRLKRNGEQAEVLTREESWPVAAINQVDFFCRVIRGEENNVGTPEYHLQHAGFVEACYQSQREGRYVNPKELIAGHGK